MCICICAIEFHRNYYGDPPFIYSALVFMCACLYEYIPSDLVLFSPGCTISSKSIIGIPIAVNHATRAQVTFMVMGLDQTQESEGHDRTSLALPGIQNGLIEAVANASSGPVILILLSGGCVDVHRWQNDPRIGAILWAGYTGMFGGLAIFDVIFGTANPSAMLTQTWYLDSYVRQVEMTNMNMRPSSDNSTSPGRGYRYFTGSSIIHLAMG
ncbi:hypothetical protein RFI_20067 [Reticulomyxa filosa]|uniref:Glycoside hydrolase family 3 C-terminal domain-containing protein n=1 Tax=Reticulomyxa filosa TaxID=46433 RepID=X6MTU1_RETFI|nr:hypothetical protein RFI_20067 [Reticulomyxa filosa]|eukprot:ETO17264.1 hypothetical protein RFI_20067 [Reticulomyxa filosa]